MLALPAPLQAYLYGLGWVDRRRLVDPAAVPDHVEILDRSGRSECNPRLGHNS